MKKIFIIFIAMLLPLLASADAIEIDGISYSLNTETKEAEVSKCLNRDAKTVTILDEVVYDDIVYRVTSIGSMAFFCCCIRSITIPKNVTSIGWRAFSGCDLLFSIKVESGNLKYDSRDNCNAIIETSSNTLIAGCRNTIIPDNVTSIGRSAFSDCSGLTFILIPNSVTSIGDDAFYNCKDLASVVIGSSVTSIGEGVFFGPITSLIMETEDPPSVGPHTITSICRTASLIVPVGSKMAYQSADGWSSFENIIESNECDLTGLEFTSGGICYRIGENNTASVFSVQAVYGGAIIPKYSGDIVIPDQLTLAGNSYSVTSIEEKSFYSLFGITSVTIGNNVTSIGNKAFSDCFDLRSVTIGNSVTSIGDAAFEWNSYLTFVNIPNSVTSIGIYAFAETSLHNVISELENPFAITNNVFKNVGPQLFVPKGTKAKYQATEGWNRFTNIIEVDEGDANCDGVVNEADVNDAVSYVMGKSPNVIMRSAADMNNDNKIDAADIVLINNIRKKD